LQRPPGLAACISKRKNRKEALENTKDAIVGSTISPCKKFIFLIKDFYAGGREGIEESNQNGDQDSDPSGSQIIATGTSLYSACDDRRDVPFDSRDKDNDHQIDAIDGS